MPISIIKTVKSKSSGLINDQKELEKIIIKIVKDNPAQVEQYKAGKQELLGYFMGQIMKETKGKADPKLARGILSNLLKK